MRALLVLTLVVCSAPVQADEASKAVKVEEMFRLLKVDQMQSQMMEQMRGMLANMFAQPGLPAEAKAAQKELEDQIFALIAKKAGWSVMKVPFTKIYSESLTEEELDGIIAFYKTPAGLAVLEKMPLMMKRGTEEVVQPLMKTLMPEMQQLVESFVQRHKSK